MTYLKDVIAASKKRRDEQAATREDLTVKISEAKTEDQALFAEQKISKAPEIPLPQAKPAIEMPAAKPAETPPVKEVPIPKPTEKLELPPAEVAKVEEEGEKRARKEFEQAEKTLVEEYGIVKIYRVEGDPMLYYTTSVSSPKARDASIINTLREAATRLIAIRPYEIRDPVQRRYVYFHKLLDIIDSAPELGIPPNRREFYAEAVVREMVGYGKIDPLVQDEQLEEIMVIAPQKPVYVFHRKYEMMKTNVAFYDDRSISDIIDKIARMVGRRVDLSQPILDARLPDGSRVNATVPPISLDGPTITIRKFRADPYSLVDLLSFKTLSPDLAAFLWLATDGMNVRPANILVAGGTGSGKTTVLNVLSSLIPATERVITLEQTAELQLPIKHWIRFETRPPSLEGTAEIDMNALVINSLRMRPDRVIVGEVRGSEASTLFTAMNTGHDGCLTPDTMVAFADGPKPIGEFVDKALEDNNYKDGKFEVAKVKRIKANTVNDKGKMILAPVVEARRKKYEGKILEIKLASGSKITVTPNHPLYTLNNNIEQVRSDSVKESDFIALPRTLLRKTLENNAKDEYWSGVMHGDGHIRDSKRLREKNGKKYLCHDGETALYTESGEIANEFSQYLANNFNANTRIVEPRPEKNCYDVHMSGFYNAINAEATFDMVSGNRKDTIISNNHYMGTNLDKFISGLFDAEGHVDVNNKALVFASASRSYVDFVQTGLLNYGISSRIYDGFDTKGNKYYRLYIYGADNVSQFANNIGLHYPEKKSKLKKILQKQGNTNVDVVPCTNLISETLELAKEKGISTRAISRDAELSQGLLQFYKHGKRNPSKKALKTLVSAFKKNKIPCKLLERLANADMTWDKITSIETKDYDGYVYDLTMSETKRSGEKPHNFIANNIVVGNSMGTLHANSAKEAQVRVTSPPMNVPELMLSGLDFIIVAQRLHEREKGTIRRITEVAEVKGVIEDKTTIENIYQWNPATDETERTETPSDYISMLQKFTGMSKTQMQKELDERAQFLIELKEKGVRKTSEVSTLARRFLEERK